MFKMQMQEVTITFFLDVEEKTTNFLKFKKLKPKALSLSGSGSGSVSARLSACNDHVQLQSPRIKSARASLLILTNTNKDFSDEKV